MRWLITSLGLSACLAVTASVFGQEPAAAATPAAAAPAAPAATPVAVPAPALAPASAPTTGAGAGAATSADGIKRDPKGIKGISPFMELISKGDRLFLARDFDGASAAYREAIAQEPDNAIGHYRMGSTQLTKGDVKEAEAALSTGLRVVGKDASLKAKLLFVLAMLRERERNSDEAIATWKDYAKNADEAKEAVTYRATAAERVTRNEVWKKTLSESGEVKTRIERRLREADEASRKSASDPKNK